MQNKKEAKLIGIDWGTSSFRAYLINAEGLILDTVTSHDGILWVKNHAFEETLNKNIGHWLNDYQAIPIIASGMITSKNGWLETPYLSLPSSIDGFADGLTTFNLSSGHSVCFITGASLVGTNEIPDIMRGEETQIIGALSEINNSDQKQIMLLPGTHSKWVVTENDIINKFMTFMTGEIFALLKDHSILGTLIEAPQDEISTGFLKGLKYRIKSDSSLLQQLFSARTLVLFDQLSTSEIADYLSGLLIGEEIKSSKDQFDLDENTTVYIIGGEELSQRYGTAFRELEIKYISAPNDVVALGHYQIAKKAGILK